jgi:putative MATE family efflux protein
LLEGPVWRAMVTLAVPIVLANILQTVYQLTDTFWLGRVGPEAVAAVSLAFPIFFFLVALGGGLAIAGAILVAQYYGAGNREAVDHVSGQTLVAIGFISLTLTVGGYFAAEPLVRLFGPEPEVAAPATIYLQITFLGIVFQFLFLIFQSLLRSIGDVKTPLLIVLMTVLLNFVLDPLFIMGWGPVPPMGVGGAALATVGTQGIASVVGMYMLFGGKVGISLRVATLRPDFPVIWQIIRLGLPASVEQSTRAGGVAMLTLLVTGFGTEVLAVYGIGTRIFIFVIIPALGFSMATSTLVGQAVGAGMPARAEEVARRGAAIAFLMLGLVAVPVFAFALPLTRVFLPGAPEVALEGARFVRILALGFAFAGVQQVLAGAFRGAGDTLAAMLLAILALWVLRFPLAFVLSYRTGMAEQGLWWSFPISDILAAGMAGLWFLTGRWLHSPTPAHLRLERRIMDETMVEEGLE